MLNKYDVLELFQDAEAVRTEFFDQLPHSIEPAFFDNEYAQSQDKLIHTLLKQFLTPSEYDDLCYFAYETSPRIEVDNQTFYSLEDYWTYCDQLEE